ncbi:SF1B family DNA helicase RecD2 [Merdibacter massiliensis]|uniref:SF1B family DNA helicase RecD2 n=1 Tax=Merdibacter massiliensis TaxID=1871030 RepID=UPI00096A6B81|nr:ATP-dependent RecD-like DNA helicase [Merdibacter massiliensis]
MEQQSIEIKAKCKFIVFENPSNDYKVIRFERIDETHASFIGVGYFKQLEREALYRLQGKYVEHRKYGIQFQIESCERILSDDTDLLVRFFSSAHFPGIGKTTAKRMVDTLGKDIIQVLRENKDALDQVAGMNDQKKQVIMQGLRITSVLDDAYLNLATIGLNNKQIARLEEVYGNEFVEELKTDPYRPFFEIDGFSLRVCERLAMQYGIDDGDIRHVRALVMQIFKQAAFHSGSTYLPKEQFITMLQKQITYEGEIEDILQTLCKEGYLVEQNEKLYDRKEYDAEVSICKKLRLLSHPCDAPDHAYLLENIRTIEKELNISYDVHQIEAIIGFFSHTFLILNGGPGTGKTTTIRGILSLYQRLYPDDEIVLAAPTGRASKRLSELSSYPASTIHSLLKWDLDSNTFLVDEHSPLHCDVLIVDEFSMVDNRLFAQLLKGLPLSSKLLIIGDCDQLPSVSCGSVLRDLIESELFPLFSLNRIYRQAEGSGIANLAYLIRTQAPLTFEKDVSFITCSSVQLRAAVCEVVKNALEKGFDAKDIQVLAPKYQGSCGIDLLNQDLQTLLNPADPYKKEVSIAGRIFREGDKVLQLRNMREDAVYNGDIGEIIEIENGIQGPVIVVAFDDQIVEYENETLYYLTHAYCISIHKSQGNEYPIVILPIVKEYHFMLNQRLLYTAITRAKCGLVLLGDQQLFQQALKQKERVKRYTSLAEQLQIYFKEDDTIPIPKPPILQG